MNRLEAALVHTARHLQEARIPFMVIGGFAGLTMLTKNSFLEEINKQYVVTARAKGLTERRVLYGHVFRNAMLLVTAGFPSAFVGILFTGSVLIEVIFFTVLAALLVGIAYYLIKTIRARGAAGRATKDLGEELGDVERRRRPR